MAEARVVVGRTGAIVRFRLHAQGVLQELRSKCSQLELAAGQQLYLVRAAGRLLLLGGTGGGLALLTELDPAQVPSPGGEGAERRADTLLQRLRARLLGAPAGPSLDASAVGIAGVATVEPAGPPAARRLGQKG